MGPVGRFLVGAGCAWLSLGAAFAAEPPLRVRFVMDWAFEGSQSIWTVADSSGCFTRAGLDVTIDRSYGSGDSVVKVASGQYDIGVSDFSTMVGFDGKNPDRRLTAIFMISDRAPMSIVTLKAANITKPSDLVGKRLADGVNEASRVMFPAFAKANGIDVDSVKWVTTTPDLRQQLLVRDQADAAAGHMFTILTGLQAIGVKQQETSVMLYDTWGVHFFGNALVATPAWLQAHPAAAKAFVACAVEGIKISITDPKTAIASLRSKNTLLDEPIELASLAFSNSIAIKTPNTTENGLSAVTKDRLVTNINEASSALGLPAPKAEDVWTEAYLPPRGDAGVAEVEGTTSLSSPYPAIYAFGDSLSDAGDAYLLTSSPYAVALGLQPEPVSPPYAQETYGGTAANVFSNGPVWVQDLAVGFGLANPGPGQVGATGAQLLAVGAPSYIVDILDGGDPTAYVTLVAGAPGGTDFAIGGSVTGPTSFNTSAAAAVTDLQSQIANFQHEIATPAAGALYTVWSGSNDVLNLLGSSAFASQSMATSEAEVAQSAANEVNAVISLVQAGARSILVGDVPNLGLIPEITAQGAAAAQTATFYAQYFNTQLQSGIQAAASQLVAATVTVLDVFGLLTATTPGAVVPGPHGNTITNITDPAYTGSFTADNGTLAANADNYLYFDQLHPTETGHQAIANLAAADLGVACYCAGTRIHTPNGDVAVEALARGEAVLTHAGHSRSVRWIGRRSYAGRFLSPKVQPVRFRAGSLGGGLPHRDLLVSPEHAMFVDGVLIPARCLIDGDTIQQERGLDRVDYLHVELDSHDIILAEGAPSESFLDDTSRGMFHNAHEFAALYPDAPPPGGFCAPRLDGGARLAAIRRRLSGRFVQEVQIAAEGLHRVAVHGRASAIRLLTPAGYAPGDARRLGAAISQVAINGVRTELADARLAAGWHDCETAWRWTDGAALLQVGDAREVALTVAALPFATTRPSGQPTLAAV